MMTRKRQGIGCECRVLVFTSSIAWLALCGCGGSTAGGEGTVGGNSATGGSSSGKSSAATATVGGSTAASNSTGGTTSKTTRSSAGATGGTTASATKSASSVGSGTATGSGAATTGGTGSSRNSSLTTTGGIKSTSSVGGATTHGGASSATSSASAALETFTTEYAKPYCTRLASCCAAQGIPSSGSADCIERELMSYRDVLAEGSAVVNRAAVKTLLDSLSDSCDQFSYALYGTLVDGLRAEGEPCTDGAQCAGTNVVCVVPANSDLGKCYVLTRGKLGDDCQVSCDQTTSCRSTLLGGTSTGHAACWDEDGLRCDWDTNQCVKFPGIGQACGDERCGQNADCISEICVKRGALGDDCSSGPSCGATLTCDPDTHRCVRMSVAWDGSCNPLS